MVQIIPFKRDDWESTFDYYENGEYRNIIEEKSIILYPNPANNKINFVSYITEVIKAEIYGTDGKLMLFEQLNTKRGSVDISSLNTGMYFVKLTTEKGSLMKKIMVE